MWKSVSYEACGRSHRRSATPCQDKTLTSSLNGIEIVALADGAGSAKFSHVGAATVTEAACAYLSENFTHLLTTADGLQVKTKLLNHLLAALRQKCEELACGLQELASTLLLVAIGGDSFIIVHIGDGVIGYLQGGQLKVASRPTNGEFVNTTIFVTSADALGSMRVLRGDVSDIDGFVLMSDGTADSLYDRKRATLAPVVRKMMQRTAILSPDRMYQLLENSFEQVIVMNTHDDCSIALLVNKSSSLCYSAMNFEQKCELFGLRATHKSSRRRVRRYDEMLSQLQSAQTLRQISRWLRLKERYTKRHLERLQLLGLVTTDGVYYSSNI